MARYTKTCFIINEDNYYEPLRKKHDTGKVRHYATPRMYYPTIKERASTKTSKHIWKLGDRLFVLADNYYGDTRFWWVIAWWNRYPTEAHMAPGTLLDIPINLEDALKILMR